MNSCPPHYFCQYIQRPEVVQSWHNDPQAFGGSIAVIMLGLAVIAWAIVYGVIEWKSRTRRY